jgi:hypothetical protein
MKKRPLVVLLGDSLLIDTVEATLGDNQDLGVVRMHTTVTDVGERLKSLNPDVIIFDLDGPHSQFVLPFLRERPGVPLLGLDITCNRVIGLTGQHYTTLTMNDLTHVIQAQLLCPPVGHEREQPAPDGPPSEFSRWWRLSGRSTTSLN